MDTLQELKCKLVDQIWQDAVGELGETDPYKMNIIKCIIERNFKKLITRNSAVISEKSVSSGEFSDSGEQYADIDVLDQERKALGSRNFDHLASVIEELLFNPPTETENHSNTINCMSHGFSIPNIKKIHAHANSLLRSLKMEYLI